MECAKLIGCVIDTVLINRCFLGTHFVSLKEYTFLLEAIASRLDAIAIRLEAIATRLEAFLAALYKHTL